MILFALSAFSVAVFGLGVAKEFTFPVCKRNANDYNVCLTRAIREVFPRFIKEIPELDWPGLEPMVFKYGEAVANSNVIRGKTICSNVTAIDFTTMHFLDARSYFADDIFYMEIDTRLSKLIVDGYCQVNGIVNGLKLNNTGSFHVDVKDVSATWNITGHVANDRWIIEHFQFTPVFNKFTFYTKDLFGDSSAINEVGVSFVNEYFPSLYRILLPVAKPIWDPWLAKLSNRFFSKVPFSTLFPEN